MKAVVTGFDAFGGDASNPSYDAVSRLPARIGTMEIVTAQLPTSFKRAVPRLNALIKREQPDIVLCVGLAADRAGISIERVAVNLDDARVPDNDGAMPKDKPVVRGGPAAYFSTLPLRKIAARLHADKIPCELSLSAGTFVCNHVFYALMHQAALQQRPLRAGFVHVPALSVLPLVHMVRALHVTLEVTRRAVR